jgi:hypothetical protein
MSWNKDNLEKAFAKVKLTLVFAKESFARGVNSEDIFGLDIRRAKPGRADSEYFLMWPGHEDNSIVIRDSDASFGQVVLTITEKEREFEETVDSYGVKRALDEGAPGQHRSGVPQGEALGSQEEDPGAAPQDAEGLQDVPLGHG